MGRGILEKGEGEGGGTVGRLDGQGPCYFGGGFPLGLGAFVPSVLQRE